jgi:hypothetical protein
VKLHSRDGGRRLAVTVVDENESGLTSANDNVRLEAKVARVLQQVVGCNRDCGRQRIASDKRFGSTDRPLDSRHGKGSFVHFEPYGPAAEKQIAKEQVYIGPIRSDGSGTSKTA